MSPTHFGDIYATSAVGDPLQATPTPTGNSYPTGPLQPLPAPTGVTHGSDPEGSQPPLEGWVLGAIVLVGMLIVVCLVTCVDGYRMLRQPRRVTRRQVRFLPPEYDYREFYHERDVELGALPPVPPRDAQPLRSAMRKTQRSIVPEFEEVPVQFVNVPLGPYPGEDGSPPSRSNPGYAPDPSGSGGYALNRADLGNYASIRSNSGYAPGRPNSGYPASRAAWGNHPPSRPNSGYAPSRSGSGNYAVNRSNPGYPPSRSTHYVPDPAPREDTSASTSAFGAPRVDPVRFPLGFKTRTGSSQRDARDDSTSADDSASDHDDIYSATPRRPNPRYPITPEQPNPPYLTTPLRHPNPPYPTTPPQPDPQYPVTPETNTDPQPHPGNRAHYALSPARHPQITSPASPVDSLHAVVSRATSPSTTTTAPVRSETESPVQMQSGPGAGPNPVSLAEAIAAMRAGGGGSSSGGSDGTVHGHGNGNGDKRGGMGNGGDVSTVTVVDALGICYPDSTDPGHGEGHYQGEAHGESGEEGQGTAQYGPLDRFLGSNGRPFSEYPQGPADDRGGHGEGHDQDGMVENDPRECFLGPNGRPVSSEYSPRPADDKSEWTCRVDSPVSELAPEDAVETRPVSPETVVSASGSLPSNARQAYVENEPGHQ